MPTWRKVENLSITASGIGPINSLIALNSWPLAFWAWIYGILVSPNYSTTIPPLHCSGPSCESYFLPGTIYLAQPQPPPIDVHPEATEFILDNTVGYQIELYPPSSIDELNNATCKIYGNNYVAVLICLKQSGNDLLAGSSFLKIN